MLAPMYTARRFPVAQAIAWTWDFFFYPAFFTTLIFALYHYLECRWLRLPPAALGILGTAVSFYLGFKGNAAYGRLWEARKIWGGIVNSSRTWGALVRDHVTLHFAPEDAEAELPAIHRELVYRHIAWLGALRTQLRRHKSWETKHSSAKQFRKQLKTEDMSNERLRKRIEAFVDGEELAWVMERKNVATQLIAKQSERLKELHAQGLLDDFRHMKLSGLIEEFYTLQGKAERIKNFPLPRQYASANHWFVAIFVWAIPLSLIPVFAENGGAIGSYLAIPCSVILAWIFLIWNKIVDWSENPFDGLGNDIPIDALSRTIEIDLREMLGETELPAPRTPQDSILM